MKTKVDFLKTMFYQDEETGQITCEGVVQLMLNDLPFEGAYEIYKKKFPYISKKGVFKVYATASCSKADDYEAHVGMKIAETKMQAKAYYTAWRVYVMIVNEMKKLHNIMVDYADGCSEAYEHAISRIDEIDYTFNN